MVKGPELGVLNDKNPRVITHSDNITERLVSPYIGLYTYCIKAILDCPYIALYTPIVGYIGLPIYWIVHPYCRLYWIAHILDCTPLL